MTKSRIPCGRLRLYRSNAWERDMKKDRSAPRLPPDSPRRATENLGSCAVKASSFDWPGWTIWIMEPSVRARRAVRDEASCHGLGSAADRDGRDDAEASCKSPPEATRRSRSDCNNNPARSGRYLRRDAYGTLTAAAAAGSNFSVSTTILVKPASGTMKRLPRRAHSWVANCVMHNNCKSDGTMEWAAGMDLPPNTSARSDRRILSRMIRTTKGSESSMDAMQGMLG
mmetsp:Transcript_27894/g.65481  ORF Transcript_27894/g.65481 Transcript_27894/m.65481 type:complete len:227 (+) Transcript_27894:78-758(+)